MKMTRKSLAAATLLLFGAAGCDLDVTNPNAADADRALASPGDVESLVGGSWFSWWLGQHNFNIAPAMFLSTASFQHSAWPANFGMVDYSAIPRTPIVNNTAHAFYPFISGMGTQAYRAVAAANDGLRAMDGGTNLGDADRRARAFAKLMQGVGHGTIAMLYSQGPIVDENTDLTQAQEFVGYKELGAAAIGFLDEAIALANQGFHDDVPYSWLIADDPVSGPELARYASTLKSHIRVAIARNPADAAEVNWQQVINDIDNGITEDFILRFDGGTNWFGTLYYSLLYQWSQMNYFVHGMADTSGKYQEWMALPTGEKHPNLPSGPFLIQTPDTRFPQGATEAAQIADGAARSGEVKFRVTGGGFPTATATLGGQWGQAGRGTWRWSYYRDSRLPSVADVGTQPLAQVVEQNLLKAEANYRLGNMAAAAALVNESRTAAGLSATDAAGTNTSCVPRLPDGSCGGLLEMIKWERRMTSSHNGSYLMNTMYFDSRRWGDLMQGTFLQFPVPCREAQLEVGIACEQFGGTGGDWAAPVGTYGY
jgi:hypothetical protein